MTSLPTKKDRAAFIDQRTRTKKRLDADGNPIEFRLTFEEWWDWWQATGHYHERGPRRGQYVMARTNDTGHYELGNIFCCLAADNVRQASVRRTGKKRPPISAEQKAKISAALKGKKKPPRTAEHQANINAALKGRKNQPASEETRLKISEAVKAAKARRKLEKALVVSSECLER
ncbi:NUMOD3 domain-containing DNA-binding protein [Paraburkholderia sp. BR10882]|uniref:NUMOD3 domain-containing DNA-binding protein n=1 Tax=unclassified Paraburkholderia TaxID=2615204 RepID=UPI0034CE2AB7